MAKRMQLDGSAMSFEEIGAALGILPHSAREIYRQGMRRLRERFPEQLRELLTLSKQMRR